MEWHFCPHFKSQPHCQPRALRRSCFPRARRLRALSGIRLFSKEQGQPPPPSSRHRARCSHCCWLMQRERQEPGTSTATLLLVSKLSAAWQRRGDAPGTGSANGLQRETGEAARAAVWQTGHAVLCLPWFGPPLLPRSSVAAQGFHRCNCQTYYNLLQFSLLLQRRYTDCSGTSLPINIACLSHALPQSGTC